MEVTVKGQALTSLCLLGIITSLFNSSSSLAASKTLKYKYDALGRVVKVEDSINKDRTYEYDDAGNRKKVIIGNQNQSPVAVSDYLYLPRINYSLTLNLLSNDSDPEGDALEIREINTSSSLVITELGNGKVSVKATDGQSLFQMFSYTVQDSAGNTDTALVTVKVGSGFGGGPIEIL